MPLGDYSIQVTRFIPKAYWKVSGATGESTIYGSGTLTKSANCVSIFRPLTFSSSSGGNLLKSSSTITLSNTMDAYKIASSSYKMNSFTINFWYQNLGSTTQSSEIMTIGTGIKLYIKDGKVILNFMGQYSYVKFRDIRDLLHISIIFDGTDSTLVVNNAFNTSSNPITPTFESSPSLQFSASGSTYQISDLAIFAYALSLPNIKLLYNIGTSQNTEFDEISATLNDISIGGKMPDATKVFDYSPGFDLLRNCIVNGDSVELKQKPLATINGATYYSTSPSYQFSTSSSNIVFQPDQSDIDFNNTSIEVVTKGFSGTNGTIISIIFDNNSAIYFKSVSGVLKAYLSSSATEKASVSSPVSSFYIDFINNICYLRSSTTSYQLATMTGSKIKSIYVGNNNVSDSNFTGYISKVGINYKNYPLQIGKYVLDLANNYGTETSIKPKQDGVANFMAHIPAGAKNNFITYYSNNTNNLVKYNSAMAGSAAGSSISAYYDGSGGTTKNSGDVVFSTIPSATSVTPAFFSVRIYDDNTGSNNAFSMIMPSVSNIRFFGYSDNKIYSDRDSTLSSTSDNSIYPQETSSNNSLRYNFGFSPRVSTALAISNVNNNLNGVRSIYFNLRVDTIPSNGTIFSIGSINVTLTNNTSSYTLSTSSGSLYVDSGTTLSGLLPYITYSILLVVPSATYTSASFSNLSGCNIFNVGLTNTVLSNTSAQVARMTQCLFNKNSTTVSDSGNTLTISENSATSKAFKSNIVLSG